MEIFWFKQTFRFVVVTSPFKFLKLLSQKTFCRRWFMIIMLYNELNRCWSRKGIWCFLFWFYLSLVLSVFFFVILFDFRGVVYSQSKKLWRHTPKSKIKYLSFFFCIPFYHLVLITILLFKFINMIIGKRNVHSFYLFLCYIFASFCLCLLFLFEGIRKLFYVLFIRVCIAWKIRLCILLRKGVAAYVYKYIYI